MNIPEDTSTTAKTGRVSSTAPKPEDLLHLWAKLEPDAKPPFETVPGYASLLNILQEAYDQSARGKGKERHAGALPFDQQPIMQIQRLVGPGFGAGQAIKKIQEAIGMVSRGQDDRAVQELLGAIVYASATVMVIRELRVKE